MKTMIFPAPLAVAIGAMVCLTPPALPAADITTSQPASGSGTPAAEPAAAPVPAASDAAAAAKLPYGVDDVLKLSRAQINEAIIVNYVQNSGTIYNLSPKDIVYLRNEGVSDRVVNTMLDQRKKANEETAQEAQQAAAAAAAPAPPPVYGVPDYNAAAAAPAYIQPPASETPAPPSTLYVIPYPQATSSYYSYPGPYYYYPYYGGYCGSTVITLHAGYGSGYHCGSHYYGSHHSGVYAVHHH